MNNDDVYTFTRKYGITGWETIKDIQWFDTYTERHPYCAGPTMVKLKMPLDRITELVNLDKRITKEYNIRMNTPAVAAAYEKYQMLLALCK